jgi:hypothetical protein
MVTVGLLVRLAAKPGNEAKVTSFLREGCRWWNRNRQRSRGSRSALLSEFGISMSPTTRVGRRMCRVGPPRPLTGRSERAPGEIWQVAASFANRGYAA